MKTFEYVITCEEGIHAVPSALLMKKAKKFDSELVMYKGNESADMKSMFGIIGLCIGKGDKIRIEISGVDEDSAMEEIIDVLRQL
ncbi:MAG: HPr family phosphocarrier protein [Eubacterium sp.]